MAHYLRDPLAFLRSAGARGDVVDLRLPRIGSVLLSNPADIEEVLVGSNRRFVKDVFVRDLRRALGEGLLTSEGDFWRRQRRLAQPAFHRDRLHAYAAQMVASAERSAAALRPGEVRDMHDHLMRLTLEVVTRTLFSSDVGDDATAVGAAVDALMDHFTNPLVVLVPHFHRLPLPVNRRFKDGMRRLDAIIYRILARRRADGGEDRGDLLSMLLSAQDEDGGRMSDAQLRDEVLTLFLAGHETTANALAWALFLLSRTPEVDARLDEELRSVLGGRAPELADLPRLVYVEHVVTESMRLYPPAWAIAREAIEPIEIGGVRFPKGTPLWMSQWVVHRDPRHFVDPDAFRPERWADGLAKRLPKFAYFPFGGGPRFCIGSAFATMETTLLLATIAQRFRFEMAPGARVVPYPAITLRPRYGLSMRVLAR
jgi:cytochrome P450